jgi:hypothetical protein
VCAQHEPDNALERRFLLGAACHGCLLVAETSCEQHNDFLDRALVVPTVRGVGYCVLRRRAGVMEPLLALGGPRPVRAGRCAERTAARGSVHGRGELAVRMFLDVQRARIDRSLSGQIVQRFAQRFRTREWPGTRMPEVYYDPRSLETDGAQRSSLHAKCVVVDRSVAFISSANFTEAAQKRNIEIGALIRSPSFAERLDSHFDALAASGIVVRVPGL